MEFRSLGRTDWKISTVSFGAWAIGGTFGSVKDDESMAALHRALDRGVNFLRHRRRLRRRAQRAAARAAAQGAQGAVLHHDQGGAPAAQADGRGLQQEEHHVVRRSQPEEPVSYT